MTATGNYKLPYGNLPRLLLAWLSTEAVRTQSRVVGSRKSLAEFMRALGIYNSGGQPKHGSATRWIDSLTPVSG